jgi:hypothetical protein
MVCFGEGWVHALSLDRSRTRYRSLWHALSLALARAVTRSRTRYRSLALSVAGWLSHSLAVAIALER